MNQFTIDQDRCAHCGTCETILPGLLTKAKDNILFVSNSNLKAHAARVYRAIFSCQNRALSLGVVR